MKTLLNYSYVKATESDWIVSCIYRGTEVIRLDNNTNTITLKTNWWYSQTTRKYMNKFLPRQIQVSQKNFAWYIKYYEMITEYKKNTIGYNWWTINVIN